MSQEAIYGRSFDEADGRTLPAETTCPECDGAVATEGGETCCTGCGLIIEEYRIDHTGNLRARFDEEKTNRLPTHCGTTRPGLSTEIGWKRDANGKRSQRRSGGGSTDSEHSTDVPNGAQRPNGISRMRARRLPAW